MKTLTLKAPAKVNYLLDVIRKRPDGYHDLRMVMQRVNLCDEITITLTDRPGYHGCLRKERGSRRPRKHRLEGGPHSA